MKHFKFATLGLAALMLASSLAPISAQVPSLPNSPYNVIVPNPASNTPVAGPIITNTARGTSTFSSNIVNNIAYNGVMCTFNQTAHTVSPSTTIEIDAYDSASASYQQFLVSGAITADATPTSIMMYPGIALTTTPTGMVIQALKLPRLFRVKQVIGGSNGSTVTGTVGCSLLR